MLEQYDRVVGAAKIPLDIKNARNARQADGSILEYGLGKLCGRVSQLRKLKREERASERARQRERERERNGQHPTSLDDDANDHESGPIHRWFWSGVQQKTILFEHIFNEQQQLH